MKNANRLIEREHAIWSIKYYNNMINLYIAIFLITLIVILLYDHDRSCR